MPAPPRPPFIRHYLELRQPDDAAYPNSDELLSIGAPFSKALGLSKLGLHHELLPPGRRTSFPHAEGQEEEFVFVIEGAPDVWIDGELFRLAAGDAVGFPAGTGIAHSFLNNTAQPVRLLVAGETNVAGATIIYPVNPEMQYRRDWWHDAPERVLGAHDGRPNRAAVPFSSRIEDFWIAFCQSRGTYGPVPSATDFGNTPAMKDELCDLVLVGRKQATTSLALWYGPDRATMPRPGAFTIMLDGAGTPCGVLETMEVREGPLNSVDAQFAADEGEGDGSLDYWLAEHRRFFAWELAIEGLEFTDTVRVIFERFRLVWQP
jgi:uncharacterized cupin superfamily protein/uncharacterized protein YhfF